MTVNKYILALILLVSVLTHTSCFAQTYTDTKYGYSVELPNEWPLQKPKPDNRFEWLFMQKDPIKFRGGFVYIHEPNADELYPPNLYVLKTPAQQENFYKAIAGGMYDQLSAYYNDPTAVYDSYRYDLPNNIFYVLKIRNIKKYQKMLGGTEGKVIIATTVLNHVGIIVGMTYGGDTDNAETVFKQILSSIKPLQ
nr:MAG TPA: PsbP [Caudoviricetes sp.]